jgi:hypothetical protein
MQGKALAILIGLLAFGPAAEADELGYTFLQVSLSRAEVDNGPEADGYSFGASAELGERIYAFGSYSHADYDPYFGYDLEVESWTAGVGYHHGVTDRVSLYGDVGYVDIDLEANIGEASDDGYAASLGLRGLPHERVELAAEVTHTDLDVGRDDTAFSVQALFNLTQAFSLRAGYSTTDDVQSVFAGLRVYWDK